METRYMGSDGSMVYEGDCLDVMRTLDPDSVDSIVTDPPYGLKFMGKQWDHGVPGKPFWEEALRVAKPGAHMFAFGGDRTYHRLVCAVEDAGWEIRHMFVWVYGSGFPKSLDVSKGIDKKQGVSFTKYPAEGVGFMRPDGRNGYHETHHRPIRSGESSDIAKQWSGWGTAVKPALEPIVLARKPLLKGGVVNNVLRYGTGGLNIDGCRISTTDKLGGGAERAETVSSNNEAWDRPWKHREEAREAHAARVRENIEKAESLGRFPANLIHDGSEEVVSLFPQTGPSGSAARFFYCAKTSTNERGENNIHPTVKPLQLMRYLCRLITPPEGVVLDPFAGSGSTLVAAGSEGFRFIGIEKTPEYIPIILSRIETRASLGTPSPS